MIVRTTCTTCATQFEILMQSGDVNLLRRFMDNNHTIPCPEKCGGRVSLLGVTKPSRSMTGTALFNKLSEED